MSLRVFFDSSCNFSKVYCSWKFSLNSLSPEIYYSLPLLCVWSCNGSVPYLGRLEVTTCTGLILTLTFWQFCDLGLDLGLDSACHIWLKTALRCEQLRFLPGKRLSFYFFCCSLPSFLTIYNTLDVSLVTLYWRIKNWRVFLLNNFCCKYGSMYGVSNLNPIWRMNL